MIRKQIQAEIIKAMKAQEKTRLETLRFLMANIKNQEIDSLNRQELNDPEIIKLVNNQIKKLNESLELFQKGKRQDLIDKAKNEIDVLNEFLPRQIDDSDLEEEINKLIKANPQIKQPGRLIGIAIKALAGKADNQRISQLCLKLAPRN